MKLLRRLPFDKLRMRFGKRQAYRPGTLYKAHRQQWQPVKPWDALNISLRYGFDNVAWGRW